MPQMARTPEATDMEAIRLIQRLATGTESGSSSREHCRSWRSAWHCSAAVGSVAAATVPGAARIDRHTHRITADHQVRIMADHRGSCSPPAVGRTHSATRVQLHHAHKDILSRASQCRQVPRCAGAPSRLTNPRVGLSPSRRHVTTSTTLASKAVYVPDADRRDPAPARAGPGAIRPAGGISPRAHCAGRKRADPQIVSCDRAASTIYL